MGKWNRECFESICQAHNLMTRRCATRLRELRKIIIDRARMHTDTEDTPNCATLRYTSKPLIEYYNHTPIIHPTCLYVYSIVISISQLFTRIIQQEHDLDEGIVINTFHPNREIIHTMLLVQITHETCTLRIYRIFSALFGYCRDVTE